MISSEHPIHDIVARAYSVFRVAAPPDLGVCTACCMEPEAERKILATPPEQLTLEQLRDWFFAATTPDLDQQIWRFLLPRILQGLAENEELSYCGIEVTLSRFPTGDQSRWTPAEWQVLDEFQRAWLGLYLADGEEHLDDGLCLFGHAAWPLESLFDQVLAHPAEVVVNRLWGDWCRYGGTSIWITAFWEMGMNEEVFKFYTSEKLAELVEGVAFGEPGELADRAAAVSDVIVANR